ncbi:MAG: lipid kinase [Candidatus Sungbacteria bacterium]|nr:lipid kinase [bacterium]MDZ4285718.1 lipid kinase [Candidatus Sungbacteria bacterium]
MIFGDYSNGNDGVALLDGTSCADLVGRKVKIVEFSISHFVLVRCLEEGGVAERDLKLENTNERQIINIFKRSRDPRKAVVTWNPYLMEIRYEKGVTMVFDSSKIPGEIIDMMAVRSDVPDNVKKALVGAWYEAMEIMASNDKKGQDARKFMAKQAGGTLDQFEQQLKTTFMFYKPAAAVAFARDEELKVTMERVRQFAFNHGLLTGAKYADHVGIQFPDGAIVGNPENIMLIFDASYMEMAARGEL